MESPKHCAINIGLRVQTACVGVEIMKANTWLKMLGELLRRSRELIRVL